MSNHVSADSVHEIGLVLRDRRKPLKDRFRALFTLRNLGGKGAIDMISLCFDDQSALLKHELAYCLGQMRDVQAIPVLNKILQDESQEAMVRHEAGEALGAIGSTESVDILTQYSTDPVIEVAETCQLALERIRWLHSKYSTDTGQTPYLSVDPAPPTSDTDVESLRTCLLSDTLPLFPRYRAMFSLRNLGSREAVLALAQGLKCGSALFRHEIAYVLGQMQNEACVTQLIETLSDPQESPMVRHECAEALGSIATPQCSAILEQYLRDGERVVRESCVVALDISEHENSGDFQYADMLGKVKQKDS